MCGHRDAKVPFVFFLMFAIRYGVTVFSNGSDVDNLLCFPLVWGNKFQRATGGVFHAVCVCVHYIGRPSVARPACLMSCGYCPSPWVTAFVSLLSGHCFSRPIEHLQSKLTYMK